VYQQVRPHPEEAREAAVSKDGLRYRSVIPGTS
jgi:hypothetical protein